MLGREVEVRACGVEEEEEEVDFSFLGVGFSRDWRRGLPARDARLASYCIPAKEGRR